MVYRYHPVTRVITIEFRPALRPTGRLEIVVTPEHAVVRSGDTIQWSVTGLPSKLEVTISEFVTFSSALILKLAAGKARFSKPPVVKDEMIAPRRGILTLETRALEPDLYKYNVLVDGKVVVDPDVEIRGPRA